MNVLHGNPLVLSVHLENLITGKDYREKTISYNAEVSEISQVCGACCDVGQDRETLSFHVLHNTPDPLEIVVVIA